MLYLEIAKLDADLEISNQLNTFYSLMTFQDTYNHSIVNMLMD